MTEWEKLLSGSVYNDFDEDLFNRRVRAKKLFRQYNKSDDSEVELRNKIMTELFESVGESVWIEPDFRCEFGKNITIENNVYINFGCIIPDCAKVTIGGQSLIGPNVGMYAVNHCLDATERVNGGCFGKPIKIGKRVWLGGDVKIVGGVTIGDDTVIGTGSVVTKDIPSGVVAVGNPCRVIRKITDKDKTEYSQYIERLKNDD